MLIFCMCTVLSVVITIEMSCSFLQGFQTGQLVEYHVEPFEGITAPRTEYNKEWKGAQSMQKKLLCPLKIH